MEHGEKGPVRVTEPKAGHKLTQPTANLKTDKFPPGTGLTAKPVEKEPLLTIDKGRLEPKGVLLDTSTDTLITNTQAGEGKDAGKIQMSNKTLISTKGLINQESGKGLMPETLTTDGKTATAGEKPAITDTSAASDGQKTPSLSGKELMPEATTGSKTATAGEKPAMAEEPAISSGQKAPLLNDNVPAVEGKPSESEPKILVGSEKSTPVAEKSSCNKADAPQQGPDSILQNVAKRESGQILSESSPGNPKEQSDNPSGDSLLHKLNPAQVQISTNQTKDRGSSTSNNSSNSDFEQILPSSDAQTPVSDQTSAFGPVAKTADNTSPGNVSTSISKQIQGSINSLSRQGDQQITIHLNPPELGKVYIKFQEQGGQITGLLEVDKIQTRVEIQQALPQIIQNLADSGIQIKRLEVVLTDQPEQQLYKEQSLQDGWAGQQPGTERGNPNSDAVETNEWLTNDSTYAGFPEPQEMLITDDSIDILI